MIATGFVYVWHDRKHKRYYIGSHMGSEDGGYVCSSTWMRNAHRRRPRDFKRRIVYRHFSALRSELLDEERRWLMMVRDHELGVRYYNKTRLCCGQELEEMKLKWKDPVYKAKRLEKLRDPEVRARQSASNKRRWRDPKHRKKMMAKRRSETSRQRMREGQARYWSNTAARSALSEKMKKAWQDPAYRRKADRGRLKQARKMKGVWQNPDYKERLKLKHVQHAANPIVREAMREAARALWQDPEYRARQKKRRDALFALMTKDGTTKRVRHANVIRYELNGWSLL